MENLSSYPTASGANAVATQRSIEQLTAEKKALLDQFRELRADSDGEEFLTKIRAIESQTKVQQRIEMLARVNKEQSEKRVLAAKVWECEQPDTDITTNSREFHAVKVRKYPKLAALQYARATFNDNKMVTLETGREKFIMYHIQYSSSEPNIYTRPASFEDFLSLNNIMLEDMTIEQLEVVIEANNQAKAEFDAAKEKFDKQKDELNLYKLSTWGLFSQRTAGHVYEFNENK